MLHRQNIPVVADVPIVVVSLPMGQSVLASPPVLFCYLFLDIEIPWVPPEVDVLVLHSKVDDLFHHHRSVGLFLLDRVPD